LEWLWSWLRRAPPEKISSSKRENPIRGTTEPDEERNRKLKGKTKGSTSMRKVYRIKKSWFINKKPHVRTTTAKTLVRFRRKKNAFWQKEKRENALNQGKIEKVTKIVWDSNELYTGFLTEDKWPTKRRKRKAHANRLAAAGGVEQSLGRSLNVMVGVAMQYKIGWRVELKGKERHTAVKRKKSRCQQN